ncbi:MAG: ATP-binding protein [Acidimicrobiales bacterium]
MNVTCGRCGLTSGDGNRFCGSCGAPLSRSCPVCGEANPAEYVFCGSCGGRLAAAAPPTPAAAEERRWVTVLFVDLSGYTALAERTDPEEVRALVDRCTATLGTAVERFGGWVDNVVGDALLAVFGAPVAHEDDAERAVRAALEMQRGVSDHPDHFGGLPIRIGINTGEVMFAPVGPDAHRHQTVTGDIVNTAARLQTAAAPGGILVGEQTWRATRAVVTYEDVGSLTLKNKAEPVPAWLALRVASSPVERAVSAVPMVGRDAELDVLLGTWRRVVGDARPHLITVLGPAGIGKSRLCQELRLAVESDGGRVLRGRSLPYGESTGYGAFAQLVKDAAGIFESDAGPHARHKLAALCAHLLPLAEAETVASHLSVVVGLGEPGLLTDRDVLFFSARRFVEALGREQPTVLGFEDSHCAEPSLLDLIEFLAARVRDVPVLIVNSARPELFDRRPGWGGGLPAYTALAVDVLSDADAEALALHHLPPSEDSDGVAERLREAAGGNPLFIEELAASLTEGATDAARALPSSVKAIIASRLDALPPIERRVLLDASVVGKTFWRGLLIQLGTADHLDEALDSLERRGLIRHERVSRIEGDVELSFKHLLTREVAYAILPRTSRRAAHEAVARFAEETFGERLGDLAAIVGHHWREAGEPERAIEYFLAAAEQAGRGWARAEAANLYRQVLNLLPDDDPRRPGIRVKWGVAYQAASHVAWGDIDALRGQIGKSAGEMSPPIS